MAGLSAGVRQIECTINGIGERAGNAALEEIVMAIKTRNDLMPYETGIKTELISKASKIVSIATGFPVQFNKAIVGKNAFGKFKILADKKKHIYDEDIVALVDDSLIFDNKLNAINL